jgi:DNA-binding HxlR family transcriptional regulator
LRLAAHPLVTTAALTPVALTLPPDWIAEVREDLFGADPDLLWVELEPECSHDGSNRLLVASSNLNWAAHYQRGLHDATKCAKITHVLGKEYEGQICSIARSLELVGERWTLLVVREIFHGRRKFSEMQRSLGVARNVLTARLQSMVEEGILERRPYSERPERYEYFLTEKGLDLWPVMISLMHWGDRYEPATEGRPSIVVHKGECGGEIDDRRICTKCGKHLTVREAKAIDGPGMKAALESVKTAA